MQQPFGIPYLNLDSRLFQASNINIFHHTAVSVIVCAVLPQ